MICGPASPPRLARMFIEQTLAFVDSAIEADIHFGVRRNRSRVMLRTRRGLRRKLRKYPVQFGKAHALAEYVPYVHPAIKQEEL